MQHHPARPRPDPDSEPLNESEASPPSPLRRRGSPSYCGLFGIDERSLAVDRSFLVACASEAIRQVFGAVAQAAQESAS
jgi:hypothetical protein